MAKVISLQFLTYAVNSICLLQTRTGAGNLIINGALQDDPAIDNRTLFFDKFQRQVTITSTGNLSGVNFTVTGEDFQGNALVEVIAGPNNNMVTTTAYFAIVTSVAVSATIATAASVGLASTGKSWMLPMDYRNNTIKYLLTFDVTGTINYTLQFTGDDIWNVAYSAVHWWDSTDTAVVGATADKTTTLQTPVTAFQITVASSSGATLDVRVVESGMTGQ